MIMPLTEAQQQTKELLLGTTYNMQPDQTVYYLVRKLGRDNLSAYIDFYIAYVTHAYGPRISRITHRVAELTGYVYDKKREAIRVNGNGFDRGKFVVMALAEALFDDAYALQASEL